MNQEMIFEGFLSCTKSGNDSTKYCDAYSFDDVFFTEFRDLSMSLLEREWEYKNKFYRNEF